MRSYLDFEKPVGELEQKIEELRAMQASGDVSVADEIERLEAKAKETLVKLGPEHAVGILSTPLFPKEPPKVDRLAEAEGAEGEEPARLHISDEGKSASGDN